MDTKYQNDFKRLVTLLSTEKIDFVVVGSLALKTLGLPCKPHDIDLEVCCSDDKYEKLKFLSDAFTCATDQKCYSCLCFCFGSTIVNIFRVEEFSKNIVMKDFIKYKTVDEVLKYKLGYKRTKDLMFYHNIITWLSNM